MTEVQKEKSPEKEKSQKPLSSEVIQNNEIEVSSLKKVLWNPAALKVEKWKKYKAPEKPLKIIEDTEINIGFGSTESIVGEWKNIVMSETSGLTVKQWKDFSVSAGLTTIIGENGQWKIEQERWMFWITLTKKF